MILKIKNQLRNLYIYLTTKLFYRIVSKKKIILFNRIADSDKFLQNKNINRSIIFWTTHKCASTFISKFLYLISKETKLKHVDYAGLIWELGNEIKTNNPFLIETECDFLYRKYGEIYGPMRTPFEFEIRKHLNNIFFLRDPRDLIVSKYYSIAYSHPEPSNDKVKLEFLNKRNIALRMDINEFFLKQIDEWIIPHYSTYKKIRENSEISSFFKYEDLKEHPKKTFLELTKNMKISIQENLVDELISKLEKPFKKKISKNQDINYSHTRSGKSRQFEYEIEKKTLKLGNDKLKDLLNYWNFKA